MTIDNAMPYMMVAGTAAAICAASLIWVIFSRGQKNAAHSPAKQKSYDGGWRDFTAASADGNFTTEKFWQAAEFVGGAVNLSSIVKELFSVYTDAGSPKDLSKRQISGALILFTLFGFAISFFPLLLILPPLAPLSPILCFALAYLGIKQWISAYRQRQIQEVSSGLPYAMDLLVMALASGASFLTAVEIISASYHDHALGKEFARILHDVNRGFAISEALEAFKERFMMLPSATTFSDHVITSQRYGNPLAETLGKLSVQIKTLRMQSCREQAGKAKVKILAPGVLIMFGGLLLLFGPFILKFLNGDTRASIGL